MTQTIEEYRLQEDSIIEKRLDHFRESIRTLVNESRLLIPAKTMSNGFSNVTPETQKFNDALGDLWDLLDEYSHVSFSRMASVMALMDTKQKLERLQEQVNEQRERAEEAEDLVTELSRML